MGLVLRHDITSDLGDNTTFVIGSTKLTHLEFRIESFMMIEKEKLKEREIIDGLVIPKRVGHNIARCEMINHPIGPSPTNLVGSVPCILYTVTYI